MKYMPVIYVFFTSRRDTFLGSERERRTKNVCPELELVKNTIGKELLDVVLVLCQINYPVFHSLRVLPPSGTLQSFVTDRHASLAALVPRFEPFPYGVTPSEWNNTERFS